jgi:hypothetical protein
MPQYIHLSPEEIRLGHYLALEKSKSPYAAKRSAGLAGLQPNGLVAVKVQRRPEPPQSCLRAPAALAPEFLSSGVICFDIGEQSERFCVHEILATTNSAFAELALKRDWKEAQDRVIPLPGEQPDTFKLWLHWLYKTQIFTVSEAESLESGTEYQRLVKAWVLGEQLNDVAFRDAVIDCKKSFMQPKVDIADALTRHHKQTRHHWPLRSEALQSSIRQHQRSLPTPQASLRHLRLVRQRKLVR